MNKMKKVVCVLLSIVLVISLSVPAFAVESDGAYEVYDEVIETTTFPMVFDQNAYDYETAESELRTHILQNNSDVTEEEAQMMAHQMIEKTREINESLASTQSRQIEERDGIYSLGRVQNGELVEGSSTYTVGYDQIIPGDWVSEPTRTSHSLNVRHVVPWYGYDSYKSSAGGKYTITSEVSTSLQLGWTATNGLTKSVAESLGINTTPTTTTTAKLTVGFEITANPWTKTMMRPYIYYYVDEYTGVRGFHCYSSLTGEYSYMTDEVGGRDIYSNESGIRTWTRENVNRNPNATSPVPPTSWEW